jgi:SAM-dependent methyltransferase
MHGDLLEAEHLVRYWWASTLADGRRVLDAACGVGYGTRMLHAAGAQEAVGLDIAEDVIDAANNSAPPGVRFVAGDVRSMPFGAASFDLVTCFETIEHVDEVEDVVAEFARVLAPGGVLLISSPNPDGYVPGNPHHMHEFRAGELRDLVSPHFSYAAVCRQFDWVTSAILTDEAPVGEGLVGVPGLQAARVSERLAGIEPYAIVVASDQAPPSLHTCLVATGLAEPRRWLDLHEAQHRVLAEQWEHWQQAETRLRVVLEQADRRVSVVEEDNRKLRVLLERADAVLAEMQRSPSWRITAPLRAVKRLKR